MKYVLLALQYLPHVLAGVQAVEGANGGAKGQDKKAIVMAAVQAGAKVAEGIPEDHVRLISGLVDSVVGTLNDSGVFQKKTALGAVAEGNANQPTGA